MNDHTHSDSSSAKDDLAHLVPPIPVRKVKLIAPMPTPKPQAVARGSDAPVLVGVADPSLHPEVANIVAATGRTRLDTTEPSEIRKVAARASAIILDGEVATQMGEMDVPGAVFLVHADPAPVDWKLAMQLHAEAALVLPAQAPELLAALGRPDRPAKQGAFALTVTGAVGGAGASTLAAAIARGNEESVLVDADPRGGGLELLLGIEGHTGIRWNDLGPTTRLDPERLVAALPHSAGVRVLGHASGGAHSPVTPERLSLLLDTLAGRSSLIVDAPSIGGCFEQSVARADSCVVVIPAEIRAAVAAHGIAAALQAARVKALAVVRHRGWSGLGVHEVEDLVGIPVVAQLPTIRRLPKKIETHGLIQMPQALGRAAQAVLDSLREAA